MHKETSDEEKQMLCFFHDLASQLHQCCKMLVGKFKKVIGKKRSWLIVASSKKEQHEDDPLENPINIEIECIRLELLHCL